MTITLTNGNEEETTSDVFDRFYQRSHLQCVHPPHMHSKPTATQPLPLHSP